MIKCIKNVKIRLSLISAVLVGLIIWWWINKRQEEQSPHKHHVKTRHDDIIIESAAADVKSKPLPKEGLNIIEGIGPKTANLLNEAGIRTLAQLAKADVSQLNSILKEAGLAFIDPSTWSEQASQHIVSA